MKLRIKNNVWHFHIHMDCNYESSLLVFNFTEMKVV